MPSLSRHLAGRAFSIWATGPYIVIKSALRIVSKRIPTLSFVDGSCNLSASMGLDAPSHDRENMDNSREMLNEKCQTQWKMEQRRRLISRYVRWGIGIPLFFALPIPWFGPFLVLLGAVLIAPDIAGFLAGCFGNIFRSSLKGKPMPIYGIPESLVAKGKYAEAEQEYEKIIQEFPNEVKPHVDMINIAVRWLNDDELAEKLFQRGMSLLKNHEDRETLSVTYANIRTRLKTQANTRIETISSEKLDETRKRLEENRQKMWR
ncbi:MAG: tetratricopeptide repeat protein [Kiritimatiellae bacterium]|nr:tetratricopeptide repeat protein [Kiritimatiellia bacterium]